MTRHLRHTAIPGLTSAGKPQTTDTEPNRASARVIASCISGLPV